MLKYIYSEACIHFFHYKFMVTDYVNVNLIISNMIIIFIELVCINE